MGLWLKMWLFETWETFGTLCRVSSLYLCMRTYTCLRRKHRWTISIKLSQWLHHDDRCHGWDLSSAAWDSFCSSHPPVVSPVSKSLTDQCVFTSVLMFIFSSLVAAPGVSHGGWKLGGKTGRHLRVCVCVFPSFRKSLNCVFSVFEYRLIRSQLTAHRPTKTLCFCLFLTAKPLL